MRSLLFLVSLAAVCATLPAAAQLGPAGVPGAPGLAPPSPEPAPAPVPQSTNKTGTSAKVPAACAKAKNVEQCVARQEARNKARAACKGKKDEEYKQCVNNYLSRKKK